MRVKVINNSIDLVPVLRAFDSEVKKNVFDEISEDWKPISEIVERYGEEGKEALEFFEKINLVETKWTTPEQGIEGRPQKMYKAYYSTFNINISCPITEMSEIFNIVSLSDEEFKKLEDRIEEFIGEEEKSGTLVAEHFRFSMPALKSIMRRSNKFVYKGMKIERKR
jgi:predicted DNA-binding ArsR family transcriptional regulator